MRWLFIFLCAFTALHAKLKVLHLTFHRACQKEFEAIAKELSFDLKTWFIPDLRPRSFDGTTTGNALYNIDHARAERIWNLHREEFEKFDVVVTSDTAPLSRIFLQNGWKKPLIIWVCNRFDYYDQESLDGDFPDDEYYKLFGAATQQPNVALIAYTAFERYYAKQKGIDIGPLTIEPCCVRFDKYYLSTIPKSVVKKETFFLPPYHNETKFMDLAAFLNQMGLRSYCGRYSGPLDLKDFKAIVHLPYSWSNLAFFENMALGIPYFIPSKGFFEELALQGDYFHPSLSNLINDHLYEISEWYNPEHEEIITYFDSWDDLKRKINETDFAALRTKILAFAQKHKQEQLGRWRGVIERLTSQ